MADAIGWYLQEIGRFPLLTAEQEITLGRQVQDWLKIKDIDKKSMSSTQRRDYKRGERAFKKFYECNLRLVVAVAKKFSSHAKHLSLMDLVQAGNLSLVHAVEKYDPSRGYKFSTYAYWWIRQGVYRELQVNERAIRLPSSVFETLTKIKYYTREYSQTNGCLPSKSNICNEFKIAEQVLDQYLNFEKGCRSLDERISNDDDKSTILETMSDPNQDPEQVLEDVYKQKIYDLVPVALDKLPKRTQEVVQMRFFSNSDKCLSQKAISVKIGCSQERVRQIIQKAFEELNNILTPLLPV